jgi:hypothetical protein
MGGEINNEFHTFFNIDSENRDLSLEDAYKYLIEWRGEEESKELAKTLLLQNPHHIDDYGGYDFFFEVFHIQKWGMNDNEPFVTVKVKVDDLGGDVTLFDGNTYNLTDALVDEDYGWEIDSEINWGIDTYFKKNITLKTGIKVIFFRPEYTSKISYECKGNQIC